MNSLSLLIFDLDGVRFGIDATRIIESVWLPELTPIEEAPPWVIGIFSLRGRIVPVTDLHLRFGHPTRPYGLSDRVVVLETDRMPIGVVASDVIEISEIPHKAIQPSPQFDAGAHDIGHLLAGEARIGEGLVALLDVSRLTSLAEEAMPGDAWQRQASLPLTITQCCPEATAEMRALFHARAMALREVTVEDEGELLGLAVVEVGGEYFGVELATVREFCTVDQVSPIPCCPPHILGVMNLRGNLVTLIDPCSSLNLAMSRKNSADGGKAVIGYLGEEPVGIVVDEVHDVVYLGADELQAPPPALRERIGAEITATAAYAGRMMTVLDLPTLLARADWVVDESV